MLSHDAGAREEEDGGLNWSPWAPTRLHFKGSQWVRAGIRQVDPSHTTGGRDQRRDEAPESKEKWQLYV